MSQGRPSRPVSTHDAVSNLLKYSQSHNNLLNKYSLQYFLEYFDRYTIQELTEKMGQKGYNKVQFVRQLTCFILHGGDETLFLVIALIDIYEKIVSELNGRVQVGVKDFTQYLCSGISSKQSQLVLHTKEIATHNKGTNPRVVRDIDVNAAVIYSCSGKNSPQISKAIKKKERRVDTSKPLHICHTNRKKKEIIALGRLASHISIFDIQLNNLKELVPNCSRLYNRNATITSMAFSQKQQRIGCLINHAGMAFWDYEDDFMTEKIVKKVVGDKIHYFNILQQWATTSHNWVYLWDLKLQTIKHSFGQHSATALNYIEEISHLKCLAISYTMKDAHKWIYIYKNDGFKVGSRMRLGHVGAQKIHYHKGTQTLLLLGTNQLPVYQIDQLSLDISLLSELKGHETLITCVTDLGNGFIVSGDDRGTLRIWDLNSLRCQQVIKVAKSIHSLDCIDSSLIFANSRLNVMQLQQLQPQVTLEEQYGVFTFYDLEGSEPEVYLFTNVSCRVYNLSDGRVKKVAELCSPEEQIMAVEHLMGHFLVSTSKAELLCYSKDFKVKWKLNSFQLREQIVYLKGDPINKFFTTVGKEGSLYVWNEQTFLDEGPRKSLVNNDKQQSCEITLFDQSQKYGLFVTGQKSPQIKLWDYESCRLCHVIELSSVPCAVKIAQRHPLLAIGCLDEKIYLYKLTRKQNIFEATFLQFGHLRYPTSKLNSLVSGLSLESINKMSLPSRRKIVDTKSIVCQGIVFYQKATVSLMAVSYGRGNIITFDISYLQSQHFRDKKYFRKAVNVQRPVKEFLQKQILKGQYPRTKKIVQEQLSSRQKLKVCWNKKIHNDTVTHISTYQSVYLSTLCLEGYYKLVTIANGDIVASLSIKHPLPTLWRLQVSQEEHICKKVHTALKMIQTILQDKKSNQEEKRIFNISKFMSQICSKNTKSAVKKKRKSVKLLKEERGTQENRWGGQESLKSMQAFRRVNLIRQSVGKLGQYNFTDQRKFLNSLKEKAEMINLLAPYHFRSRLPKYSKEEEQKLDNLVMKSAQVSPTHSLEKIEKPQQKPFKSTVSDSIYRKVRIYHNNRSVSRSLNSLQPLKKSFYFGEQSEASNRYSQLQSQEPMKNVSNFIKTLKSQIPKEHSIIGHLKKKSGLIPKF